MQGGWARTKITSKEVSESSNLQLAMCFQIIGYLMLYEVNNFLELHLPSIGGKRKVENYLPIKSLRYNV